MMTVGESIETHIGRLIPHVMLTAAFGNWVSGIFGLVTGERMENYLKKVYPAPELSPAQLISKTVHKANWAGRFVGISLGCLVGAIAALPWLDFGEKKEKEEEST